MPSQNSEIVSLRAEVARLSARLVANDPNQMVPATVGFFVKYGCKVTEGSDATDMVVKLEGQASGDSANLNPKLSATPSAAFQYPNIASCPGGMFRSADTTATVTAVPSTGTGRYDIAYIFQGKDGGGFQIAAGTASAAVKTDFDTNGLQTADYGAGSPDYDPALPAGALPLARIYVEDDVTGIPDARIADIRDLTSSLFDGSGLLAVANNLSDVNSASTSRTNLGLGTSDSPTFAGASIGNVGGNDYVQIPGGQIDLRRASVSYVRNRTISSSLYLGITNGAGTLEYPIIMDESQTRIFQDGSEVARFDASGQSFDSGTNYLGAYQTYTPTPEFGGASTGITGTFSGRYAMVGKNACHLLIQLTFTNKGSATGALTIPLPLTAKSSGLGTNTSVPVAILMAGAVSGLGAFIASGGADIQIFENIVGATGSGTAIVETDIGNTTVIRLNLVYETA